MNFASSFPALTCSFFFLPFHLSGLQAMVGHDIPAPGAAAAAHPTDLLHFKLIWFTIKKIKLAGAWNYNPLIQYQLKKFWTFHRETSKVPTWGRARLSWGPRGTPIPAGEPFLGTFLLGEPDGNICRGFCGCSWGGREADTWWLAPGPMREEGEELTLI